DWRPGDSVKPTVSRFLLDCDSFARLPPGGSQCDANQHGPVGGEFTTEQGKSRDFVAEKFGVGGQAVTRAKAISLSAPDLVDDIKSGARSINDAYNEMKRRQDAATGQNMAEAPHDRFDKLVDSKISSLSELIADHAPIMRADEARKVTQSLANLIRQVEALGL
ncbi:MAG: hypothetical protein ACREMY_07960, partial [bacterium]